MDVSEKKQVVEKASFLVSELEQACEFVLDDDVISNLRRSLFLKQEAADNRSLHLLHRI